MDFSCTCPRREACLHFDKIFAVDSEEARRGTAVNESGGGGDSGNLARNTTKKFNCVISRLRERDNLASDLAQLISNNFLARS